jgi:hypothetical protein
MILVLGFGGIDMILVLGFWGIDMILVLGFWGIDMILVLGFWGIDMILGLFNMNEERGDCMYRQTYLRHSYCVYRLFFMPLKAVGIMENERISVERYILL